MAIEHIVRDLHKYVKKIDDSIKTINLDKYLLLNGIIEKNGNYYGEYIKINHNDIEYYHIKLDNYNLWIDNRFLTYRLDKIENVEPIRKEYYKESDIEDIKEKLLFRIGKYFTINELSRIGISPGFIDKNYKSLLENNIYYMPDQYEFFNKHLPLFYIEAVKKCRDMECVYNVYKKKKKDVSYILKDIL